MYDEILTNLFVNTEYPTIDEPTVNNKITPIKAKV